MERVLSLRSLDKCTDRGKRKLTYIRGDGGDRDVFKCQLS